MRGTLFIAVLFFYYFSYAQTPHGRLYFFTVPGGVIPAYLGYIEYPDETYQAIDSFLFNQFVDIALIDGKLFAAKLENVTGYDTTDHVPTDSVTDVHAKHIAAWNDMLAAISWEHPYFRVYDISSDSLLFSLDTPKIAYAPLDLAIWDDKAFLMMTNNVVVVDLVTQDTIATVATPHPYLGQDQNIFIVDAGANFYIGVGYATGAIRSSLLKMNKTTYQVETVFHNEGYAIEKPVVAGDKIYFGAFDTHYSITDDSLYISNNSSEPFPVAYDPESASLFLYHYTPNSINYFTGNVFSDTLQIPYYLSEALFAPARTSPCASFCVTDIALDSTGTYLEIPIFFDEDPSAFINYPYVTAVTDANGDTIATGNMNFFGQFGGTIQTYNASTALDSLPANFVATVYFRYDTSVCALSYPCPHTCFLTPTVTGNVLLCPDESGILTTQTYDSYQWYKRSFSGTAQPIAGANSQTLAIDRFNDVGYYFSVEVTHDGCTKKSAEVLVDSYVFLLPVVSTTGDFTIGNNGETIICQGDTAYYNLQLPYDTLITWSKDGSPLTGITGNTLTVTDSGFYAVEGAPSVCPNFVQQLGVPIEAQVVNCTTGVSSSSEIALNCYWNFSENAIYIKNIPISIGSLQVALYTAEGKLLNHEIIFAENTNARLSLPSLINGAYILRLRYGNKITVRKFAVVK